MPSIVNLSLAFCVVEVVSPYYAGDFKMAQFPPIGRSSDGLLSPFDSLGTLAPSSNSEDLDEEFSPEPPALLADERRFRSSAIIAPATPAAGKGKPTKQMPSSSRECATMNDFEKAVT